MCTQNDFQHKFFVDLQWQTKEINEFFLLLKKQLTMYLKSLNLVCRGEMLYKALKIVRFDVIDF